MHIVRQAFLMIAGMTILTGVIYPLAMTAVAQIAMPARANGSRIERSGRLIGSEWIGQRFAEPKYFWGRPSATVPNPYQAEASSGSNLSPAGEVFREQVFARLEALRKADPGSGDPVPVDLVTASGSGLDPHISPEAAYYQASRVAEARGVPIDRIRELINARLEPPFWGFLGEPRVNVLLLNLDLDEAAGGSRP
jgi:K+-transporting ATPase ATPase C chain